MFWTATDYIGIDQGPIVMMIENHLTGSVWDRFMQNSDVQNGLSAAGFGTLSPVTEEESQGPLSLVDLGQNAPNPFSGSTLISYKTKTPGPVTLRVYDMRGCLVREVNDRSSGSTVQHITLEARDLASGIYSYSLEANGQKVWKRCIVIK